MRRVSGLVQAPFKDIESMRLHGVPPSGGQRKGSLYLGICVKYVLYIRLCSTCIASLGLRIYMAQRFILALIPSSNVLQSALPQIIITVAYSIKVMPFIFLRKRFRKISTNYTLFLDEIPNSFKTPKRNF